MSPEFTAQSTLQAFTNNMTLFSLSKGGDLIRGYVECNWIILLEMITAVANYICLMDTQHYRTFCQICRQMIVSAPQ